jgi:serine/threonine-protein kinase
MVFFDRSVNRKEKSLSEGIECFAHLPDHHDMVEPYFGLNLRPGHTLDGRFLLGEPISNSGMATIFKAEDLEDDNQVVAIKVPKIRYEADPTFFARFQREEEIGSKLGHPFILKFVPVARKSRPYIVTEYLRGCTLAHLLHARGVLSEKDALGIARLVCAALQHLHGHGVIHRDLKPDNIMICPDRTIRIMDFGIASASLSRKITLTGLAAPLGTPEYMAPEQVKNTRTDERTDIYSLGAILYEMLTGVVPFQNDNCWVAMSNRVTGDPMAPRKLNPSLSVQAEEIILHAMQRDPADRYPTVSAFQAELDAPQKVFVSGYCNRLQSPRWKLGMRETPIIAGTLIGLGCIALQVVGFLVLYRFLKR